MTYLKIFTPKFILVQKFIVILVIYIIVCIALIVLATIQKSEKPGASGTITGSSVFPLVISCPVCTKKLRSTRSGRFRCSGCKSVLAINDNGEVSLG